MVSPHLLPSISSTSSTVTFCAISLSVSVRYPVFDIAIYVIAIMEWNRMAKYFSGRWNESPGMTSWPLSMLLGPAGSGANRKHAFGDRAWSISCGQRTGDAYST
jgi:hypothetical protein